MEFSLKFLAPLPKYEREKPFTLYGFPEEVEPKSNCEFQLVKQLPVIDGRRVQEEFTLDTYGFEFHRWPTSCNIQPEVFEQPEYRDEVWKLLQETRVLAKHTLRASKVFCFDWRVGGLTHARNAIRTDWQPVSPNGRNMRS
jgi:hypothetical protein